MLIGKARLGRLRIGKARLAISCRIGKTRLARASRLSEARIAEAFRLGEAPTGKARVAKVRLRIRRALIALARRALSAAIAGCGVSLLRRRLRARITLRGGRLARAERLRLVGGRLIARRGTRLVVGRAR